MDNGSYALQTKKNVRAVTRWENCLINADAKK